MKLNLLCACVACLSIASAGAGADPESAAPRAPAFAPLHPAVLAGRLERAPARGGYTDLHAPLAPGEARRQAGYAVPKREPVASPVSSTVYVPALDPEAR